MSKRPEKIFTITLQEYHNQRSKGSEIISIELLLNMFPFNFVFKKMKIQYVKCDYEEFKLLWPKVMINIISSGTHGCVQVQSTVNATETSF